MSAVVSPAPVSPSAGSKVLKAATDTLKLVVGMAASPGGLALATSLLGPVSPAVLLVEQFVVRILGPLLTTWAAPDISEEDVAANLATKGFKVVPYDPMAAFG
jgi:hypothetical protein